VLLERVTSSAREYRRLVEEPTTFEPDVLQHRLQTLLLGLYTDGLALPDLEPTSADSPELLSLEEQFALYRRLRDHLAPGERCWRDEDTENETEAPGAELCDHLVEIYVSLRVAFDDTQSDADMLFNFRFQFWISWGSDALQALLSLHRLLNPELQA
jgi:Domain of unknown function (DUF5063)